MIDFGLPLDRAYDVDFSKPDWHHDWTVFQGTEVVEPTQLDATGDILEAHFNRTVDPRNLRITFTATMHGPRANGKFSDLSCHVGNICFCVGGRLNTFTGITTPTQKAQADGALIEVGKRHEITAEIRGVTCSLTVDGAVAAELTLDEPITDGDLRLYTWAGLASYHTFAMDTPGGLTPLPLHDSRAVREAKRRRLNATSLLWIEPRGKFLHECTLPGEGRDVGYFPAHPNGIQLSKNRCLLLYTTRAYAGNDDERSGIYQLRADTFDGPIIAEGWISKSITDWNPLDDGKQYVLQNGHPTAFGVPKGALIGGRRVAHENVFACLWRVEARWIDPDTGFMPDINALPQLKRDTQAVMWSQFRLNDAEDDIDFIQTVQPLRMAGYETGDALCNDPEVTRMNAGFVPAQPINDDFTEWANCNTVVFNSNSLDTGSAHDSGAVAPLRYRFNAKRGLYEWVELGPKIGEGTFEASIVRDGDGFIVASRRAAGDGVAWARMDDLFGPTPKITISHERNTVPLCVFRCADGVVRRTGGSVDTSPHGQFGRDPVYLIDVDADNGFAESNHRVIFDARGAHVPIPTGPLVDFAKVLPHLGGREQLILFRLRSAALNDPANPRIRVNEVEFDVSGIYAAKIYYREAHSPTWTFA